MRSSRRRAKDCGAERSRNVAVALSAMVLTICIGAGGCSRSSTGSSVGQSQPPGTGPDAPYVDVNERIEASLDANGSVSGTPQQMTELSGAGQGPVTLTVPMSSNGFNPRAGDPKPTFANGVATFHLDFDGSKVHKYTSDFANPLPLTVTPTYQLNGTQVSADDLKGKSGTLTVTYEVTNVAQQATTVTFSGFDGKPQTDTVTAPLPILAHLAVTLPSDATDIDAPGANTSVDRSGTKATWTFELVPPLGPLTQSFSYSMNLQKASIPNADLDADVIVPSQQPDGRAAQDTAKAVGAAQAAAAKAMADVQADAANLQALQAQLEANSRSASNGAINGLGDGAQGTISSRLSGDVSTASSNLVSSLTELSNEIATATASSASHTNDLLTDSTAADKLAKDAGTLSSEASTVATSAEQVSTAAADAENALGVVQTDLDAFPALVKLTPEWLRTKADLDAATVTARAVAKLSQDVATAASKLATDVQSAAEAAQAAATAAQARVTDFETSVLSSLQHDVTGAIDKVENGSADLESKTNALQASLEGAGDALNQLVAQAHADLDAALASADAAARDGMSSAQAGVQQAADAARGVLDKANSDYAQLLAIEAVAMDHALPGGNATGARNQSGHYHYKLAGS